MTDHMPDKALLVSAGQLVDGRGGAPLADVGVLVDANGMISWVGPMAQAPQLPDEGRRVALPGTLLPGYIDLLADARNITLVVQDGRIVKHTTATVVQDGRSVKQPPQTVAR